MSLSILILVKLHFGQSDEATVFLCPDILAGVWICLYLNTVSALRDNPDYWLTPKAPPYAYALRSLIFEYSRRV